MDPVWCSFNIQCKIPVCPAYGPVPQGLEAIGSYHSSSTILIYCYWFHFYFYSVMPPSCGMSTQFFNFLSHEVTVMVQDKRHSRSALGEPCGILALSRSYLWKHVLLAVRVMKKFSGVHYLLFSAPFYVPLHYRYLILKCFSYSTIFFS